VGVHLARVERQQLRLGLGRPAAHAVRRIEEVVQLARLEPEVALAHVLHVVLRSDRQQLVAAAKLLKRNRKILGNWALSVTAFNHGTKGLPKLDEDEAEFKKFAHLFDPCSKRKGKAHLAWAGRNYYAEFLAVLHAEAYRKLFYGEAPTARIQSVTFRTAPAGKTPVQFSMETGISLQEFRLYNPDYQNVHRKFPKKYMIAVPTEGDDLAGLGALRPSLKTRRI
jgi:hypothetical protein